MSEEKWDMHTKVCYIPIEKLWITYRTWEIQKGKWDYVKQYTECISFKLLFFMQYQTCS